MRPFLKKYVQDKIACPPSLRPGRLASLGMRAGLGAGRRVYCLEKKLALLKILDVL